VVGASDTVEHMLASDGAVVHDAVLAAIPRRQPHHLYEMVAEYPRRGGKAFRPAICLCACRAFGGSTDDVLDIAVAIELMHNAFLVHDDIEDGSERRRSGPSLHVRHGIPHALNAGDALMALAVGRLARASHRFSPGVGGKLLAEFAHLLQRTVEGQATEMSWTADGRTDVTEGEYLAMVRDKTCWYSTIHPLRAGALVGSRGRADLDSLTALGFFLGTAFQIDDDMTNLLAIDGAWYGKDRSGDVLEGKRTVMLIHLLRTANARDRATVLRSIGPSGRGSPEARIATVVSLMDRYGSLDHARDYQDALVGAARAELHEVFAGRQDDPDVRLLTALALSFGTRSRAAGPAPTSGPGCRGGPEEDCGGTPSSPTATREAAVPRAGLGARPRSQHRVAAVARGSPPASAR
jgi:geranylgeranyl diphosphate synthase type II